MNWHGKEMYFQYVIELDIPSPGKNYCYVADAFKEILNPKNIFAKKSNNMFQSELLFDMQETYNLFST